MGGRGGQEVLERHVHPLGGLLGHLGGDKAWSHGVRGYAELAQLDCQGLGEALDAGLGGRVVGLTAVALGGRGGQVDDPAMALGSHMRLGGFGHQERAAQVDVHDGVPVLDRHLEDQVVADDAGIVDQDGRGTKLHRDSFHGSLDLIGLADVDTHGEGTATGRRDRQHRLGARAFIEVQDCDRVSVLRQTNGRCGSDASGCAGDDRGSLGGGGVHVCLQGVTTETTVKCIDSKGDWLSCDQDVTARGPYPHDDVPDFRRISIGGQERRQPLTTLLSA